jgi:hypothetical protein
MSIMLCIGASFDRVDVSDLFLQKQGVWLGYTMEEAQEMTKILEHASIGTWVCIKSFSPSVGLIIKAVGYIKNYEWYPLEARQSYARQVHWLWNGEKRFERINDKMDHMRAGALYPECNQILVQDILELIKE